MVSYHRIDQDILVEKVQVSDLENAGYLPQPMCVRGMWAMNENWRSPEANFKGTLNKPTDLFLFGLVVSANMSKIVSLLTYEVHLRCPGVGYTRLR